MSDIYSALAVVLILSAALFALGFRLGKRLSRRAFNVLAVLAVAFIVLHVSVLQDSFLLARLIPFSNVIVLGNWLPLAVAFLSGLALGRIPKRPWRKRVLVAALLIVGLRSAYGHLLGRPPECGDRWRDGVCIQTSPASCGAACAATLLRACGIQASESEMARSCLTRAKGTTMLGLYRGLRIKTAGTAWDVTVFRCGEDELRQRRTPAILLVGFGRASSADPRYEREWGWTPGVPHTVVFFGFAGEDMVEVGDPSIGREHWSAEDLRVLWRGRGVGLAASTVVSRAPKRKQQATRGREEMTQSPVRTCPGARRPGAAHPAPAHTASRRVSSPPRGAEPCRHTPSGLPLRL